MKNPLNWRTTNSQVNRYLYLTIMRDMKAYCLKGYCELEIAIMNFVELPNSLIKRELSEIAFMRMHKYIIIDWANRNSIDRFLKAFIKIVSMLNHVRFDEKAYNQALDQFTQNLSKHD